MDTIVTLLQQRESLPEVRQPLNFQLLPAKPHRWQEAVDELKERFNRIREKQQY